MIKIANFGCGVNSVAGILHYGFENYDEIIFSDTGSEKPETYEYLKYLINEKNWKITIINDHFGKTVNSGLENNSISGVPFDKLRVFFKKLFNR